MIREKTLMFYINAINGGGAERVIIQLAHHFANSGYNSILVTSFRDPKFEYEVPNNVRRISIEDVEVQQSRIKRNITRIVALRRICNDVKPIAIISFMGEPNFRAIIATLGMRVKRIVSVRNDPNHEYRGLLGKVLGKVILPTADGCVFQTPDAQAWFPKRLQKRSEVILNDVREEFFSIERSPQKQVVSVGRLSKQKNYHLLIEAFSLIANKHEDYQLNIYGAGVLFEELQKLINSLNMENHIKLCGATTDVSAVLKSASLFVLSSDHEGMPNCLMEALAAGVPSISTDCPCGGPRMLINDNENGILVPVNDVETMAEKIDYMLSNVDEAERMGKNAREKAKDYSPDIVFQKWKNFVERVIL